MFNTKNDAKKELGLGKSGWGERSLNHFLEYRRDITDRPVHEDMTEVQTLVAFQRYLKISSVKK